MSNIQLIVKEADMEGFSNWPMTIYKPAEEDESQRFKICVTEGYSGEAYLNFPKNVAKKLRSYILELSRSPRVELVIGEYSYSQNKEEVERLKGFISRMLPCNDLDDAEVGIALYNEGMKEMLGIDAPVREVELITV